MGVVIRKTINVEGVGVLLTVYGGISLESYLKFNVERRRGRSEMKCWGKGKGCRKLPAFPDINYNGNYLSSNLLFHRLRMRKELPKWQ